jgi:hypothetical protein
LRICDIDHSFHTATRGLLLALGKGALINWTLARAAPRKRRARAADRVSNNNNNQEKAMDLGTAIAGLNWLAVFLAAATAFVIGAIWYSRKVFGNAWMLEVGLTEDTIGRANIPLTFGGTFLLQFVAATALAFFLGSGSDWLTGLQAGVLVAVCWIATAYGITYFFEQRSLRLYLINAGYYLVLFAAMGAIIGAFN